MSATIIACRQQRECPSLRLLFRTRGANPQWDLICRGTFERRSDWSASVSRERHTWSVLLSPNLSGDRCRTKPKILALRSNA